MLSVKRVVLGLFLLALWTLLSRAQDPVPIYPDNYKVLLENDRVRVLDFKLRKGGKEDFHMHPAAVTYVLEGFKIRFKFPDGRTLIREAKAGDVFFGEAVTHSPENIGDTDAHGLLVEFKGPVGAAQSAGPSAADAEMITAVTLIRGIEGKEEELKNELLALSAPTRTEAGCVRYDLYQSPDKKNEFMRYEVWRSLAALEEHKQTPHIQASFKKRQEQGWTTQITVWKRVAN